MNPFRRWDGPSRIALGAVFAATALVLYVERRAAADLPSFALRSPVEASISPPPLMLRVDSHAKRSSRRVLRAVDRDPFRAERRRPPGRYQLPGMEPQLPATQVSEEAEPPPPSEPLPPMRVLAIAVLGGGQGLAAVEVEGNPPRVLRIGDEIQGFRLISIAPGEVHIQGPDTAFVLQLPTP